MTPLEIAEIAYNNTQWRGNDLVIAVAVAMAESGGDPAKGCRNCLDDDVTGEPISESSHGLWQINIEAHSQYGGKYGLLDPALNARAAYEVWTDRKGWDTSGWQAWSVYSKGWPPGTLNEVGGKYYDLGNSGALHVSARAAILHWLPKAQNAAMGLASSSGVPRGVQRDARGNLPDEPLPVETVTEVGGTDYTPGYRGVNSVTSNGINENPPPVLPPRHQALLGGDRPYARGFILHTPAEGGDSGDLARLNFVYNPTELKVNHPLNPLAGLESDDPMHSMSIIGPSMTTFTVELLFDRTDEAWGGADEGVGCLIDLWTFETLTGVSTGDNGTLVISGIDKHDLTTHVASEGASAEEVALQQQYLAGDGAIRGRFLDFFFSDFFQFTGQIEKASVNFLRFNNRMRPTLMTMTLEIKRLLARDDWRPSMLNYLNQGDVIADLPDNTTSDDYETPISERAQQVPALDDPRVEQ